MSTRPFYPRRTFAAKIQLKLCYGLIGISVFMSSLLSADEFPTIAIDSSTFKEKYDPNVNVSGQVRAGFMLLPASKDSAPAKVQLDNLLIDLEQANATEGELLCFKMVSRDGVYSATWNAPIDEETTKGTSLQRIPIPTKQTDKISEYTVNELVVAATIGKSCRDSKRAFLPTSWGVPSDGDRIVRLYINADATETQAVVHLKEPKKKDTYTCEQIPNTLQTVAFDTVCEFTIKSDSLFRAIGIKRENFGSDLKPRRLSFRSKKTD